MNITQIAAIGIIGTILVVTIKKYSPEFSIILSLITGVLILLVICSYLDDVISIFKYLAENSGINSIYISIVLKIMSIAYIAQFACQICSDAGDNSTASKIELAGKVLIIVVSVPVFIAMIDMIEGFL